MGPQTEMPILHPEMPILHPEKPLQSTKKRPAKKMPVLQAEGSVKHRVRNKETNEVLPEKMKVLYALNGHSSSKKLSDESQENIMEPSLPVKNRALINKGVQQTEDACTSLEKVAKINKTPVLEAGEASGSNENYSICQMRKKGTEVTSKTSKDVRKHTERRGSTVRKPTSRELKKIMIMQCMRTRLLRVNTLHSTERTAVRNEVCVLQSGDISCSNERSASNTTSKQVHKETSNEPQTKIVVHTDTDANTETKLVSTQDASDEPWTRIMVTPVIWNQIPPHPGRTTFGETEAPQT